MTAREGVQRTQRLLSAGLVAAALAWGAAVALALLAIVAFGSSILQRPALVGQPSFTVAIALGFFTAVALLWRGRRVASESRVALWIEEKLPDLHYALVTAVEPPLPAVVSPLENAVARADVSGVTNLALRRSVLPAAGALLLAGLLLYVSPASAFGRSTFLGRIVGGATRAGVPAASRLDDLRAEIIPPSYSRQGRRTVEDPSSIRALVGSTITVSGAGSSSGVIARVGSASIPVGGSPSSWRTRFAIGARPEALTLVDRSYERVIVLEPQVDESPKIALMSPVRDTTLRTPRLVVRLHSQATDDVGLSSGYYEYLITSGAGEIFTGRTINTPPVELNSARSASLDATLDLASLKLSQGDVVSIRAVVRDGNTLSGPSIGTSDTRTIRIARADEYDSTSIEAAAPPPVDSSAISQRMLILMTEELVKKEKTLSRQEWVRQSTDIGTAEDRIRKRVYDILYQSESQDAPSDSEEVETGVEAIENKDLREAYNALWEAVRSLQIAEPKPALPPMRVALAALDRARLAKRVYLRGAQPKIVVDLQRVRLTGKEKGTGSVRTPRSSADSVRVRLSTRFNAALNLVQAQPARAVRDFALLRVEALTALPELAVALAEATDAMRAGRDATLALQRARRALDGPPRATPGLPAWSGG
ncbi:MAG: DUF4175 domain-containing protein [Gemmatimonadota bacterium]|nr:DUF4175 domain-containing protein [Gemmatimonadota bacterium]